MNRQLLNRAAASAVLLVCLAPALAVPTPPISCTGVPGVGGCAPYLNVALSDGAGALSDGAGALNLYEYELPQIDISRSLTLSDARVTGDLQRAELTVSSRLASDGNPSTLQAVDVGSVLVDLFTLHSGGVLPPGANVGITVTGSAQGVGSIDADYHVVQSLLHLGSGSGVVGYHGGVLDAGRVIQSVTHWPTFQQFVVPLQVYANLTVQVGVPFELNLSLRAIITESSFMNFDSFFGLAHGAQLSFVLPAGFNVTSMGGFDSAAPVPEPGAGLLMALGVAALWARRRSAARLPLLLLGAAGPCLAAGELGSLPACTTAAACTPGLYSSVSYQARRDVNATPGYNLGSFLQQGATVFQDSLTASDNRVLATEHGLPILPPVIINPWAVYAGAHAQTDFGANRAWAHSSRAVSGSDAQGNEQAQIVQGTTAQAYSAWQDVWSFSAPGHFSTSVLADGSASLDPVGGFPGSFQFSLRAAFGDWYMDVRVWDMDNFTVSDDFELGGPTLMARATLRGNNEQRSSFAGSMALDFDFLPGVTYVVTSNLSSTVFHGRELDLFHTGRLAGASLSGGATLSALSGHDYLAPVPEPQPTALLAAGLAALVLWSRRRIARAP